MSKKQERPQLSERKKELSKTVRKDAEAYSALEAVKNSEGGQLITSALKNDIITAIDKISRIYKTGNHAELMAVSAELSEKIALYRTISRSSTNKKLALQELQAILDESEEE